MPMDASKFINSLHQRRYEVIRAAEKAVDEFGEHVIGDAQQLTPVDTGALQASGTTEPAELHGSRIEKAIGFNTDYAAAVHENLNAHHETGQAKFLETAMSKNAPKFNDFMARRLKPYMEGDGGNERDDEPNAPKEGPESPSGGGAAGGMEASGGEAVGVLL